MSEQVGVEEKKNQTQQEKKCTFWTNIQTSPRI